MAEVHWGNLQRVFLFFLYLPKLCYQQGACPALQRLTCIDVNDCYYESTVQVDRAGAVYACACNALRPAEPPSSRMFRLEGSPDVGPGQFYWLNAEATVTDLQHYIISNAVSSYTEGELDQLCVYYNHTKRTPDRKMCKEKLPYICRIGGTMIAKPIDSSWYGSRNLCLEEGGDLAYLFNGEQPSLIDEAARGRSMWIGSTMQKWNWKNSGAEIKYTHWAPDQPLGREYLCIQWIAGRGWVSVLCENTRARALCYGPYMTFTPAPTPPATPVPTPPAFLISTSPARPFTPPVTQPYTPPVTVTQPFNPPVTLPVTPPVTPPVTAPFRRPTQPAFIPSGTPPAEFFTDVSTRMSLPWTDPSTVPPNPQQTTLVPSSIPSTQPFVRTFPATLAPTLFSTPFPTAAPTKFIQTTPTIRTRDPNAIDPQPLNTNNFSNPSYRTKLIAGIVAGLVGFVFLLILIVAITAWRRQKNRSEYDHHIEESSDEGTPSANTYSGTMNHGAALPPIVEDLEPAYSTLGRSVNNPDMAESAQVSSDPSYSFYGMDTSKPTSDAVYAKSNKIRNPPSNNGFAY